jgi:aspartyl-tRNA(Asn)/glutamyl-tRNA(Gln) amidotransferase subunit A
MMTATPIRDADEISRMGAPALRRAFAARTLSPVEVAQSCIDNAERANPVFNAFTFLDHDGALAAARASEARWRRGEPQSPVDGVPGTLKDIVWVKGWTVRYGSRTTSDTAYLEDAPSVAMMREKGVVFLGQTTTPEFGWKAVTDSALTGVTRNAWDASKTSGGSSGGAAVAAATGAGVFHLGTDGGGSIRVPSAFNGIVGLKPTFGRVPAYPASAFGTVAHIGPMVRRVSDAAAMLGAMAGRSDKDWAQGPGLLPPLGPVEGALVNARVGYWREPPCGKLDPEVGAAVDAAAKRLEALGARVEPIVLPGSDHLAIFNTIWFSGAAARLEAVPQNKRDLIEPGFLETAASGAAYRSVDLAVAQSRRREFGAEMDQLLARYDFVISPATAIPAFGAGLELPDSSYGSGRWTEWAGFSFPINLSQQPALTVPCGRTAANLPIGLQIIGARGADARVLGAGLEFETAWPEFFI